jgi:hypothetical protein
MEHRHDNRLAIALLSGRDHSVADNRERASSRRKHRVKLLARRQAEAAEQRRREQVWGEHEAILGRIEEERHDPTPRAISSPPRIRSL